MKFRKISAVKLPNHSSETDNREIDRHTGKTDRPTKEKINLQVGADAWNP